MRRRRLVFAFLFVWMSLLGGEARAQLDSPDLSTMSVEELAELDVVYAASRHRQTQREAPSLVTVVTSAEIRRYGHRTLADVLRSLSGFYATDDHNYTYLGVRGFGLPGDYNTRILLLVDGVRLNENIYDMAFFGREFPIDLSLVDRIEVVRGPGAAVYGNNAFFAVVNVVTRRGRHVDGAELALEAGSAATGGARVTYGRQTAAAEYLVSASGWRSGGDDLFFPEYADESGNGLARDLDGERAARVFASLGSRGFTLQATHVDRAKDVPTASYETVFGDRRNGTIDTATRVTLQYERELRGVGALARLSHGRYRYSGTYVYPEEWLQGDYASGSWWSLEATGSTRRKGSHLLTFGAELQWDTSLRQWSTYPDGSGFDVDGRGTRWGAFMQDDLRLGSRLTASAGLRYDRYRSVEGHTSPRLGLVLAATESLTLKALYGTAFRAPNEYERRYYDRQGPLGPETIRTAELVAEKRLGSGVRLAAAAFHNAMEGLIELRSDDDAELAFHNLGRAGAHGLELSVESREGRDLRLGGSYTYQVASDRDSGEELSNSPRHMAKASVSLPLGRLVDGGVGLRYMSSRRAPLGGRSNAVFLMDLNFSAPAVWSRLELDLAVRNLLGTRWTDPGSEEHRQRLMPQDGRRIELSAAWRF
jgi:iron complex outermembrane receptor protein